MLVTLLTTFHSLMSIVHIPEHIITLGKLGKLSHLILTRKSNYTKNQSNYTVAKNATKTGQFDKFLIFGFEPLHSGIKSVF